MNPSREPVDDLFEALSSALDIEPSSNFSARVRSAIGRDRTRGPRRVFTWVSAAAVAVLVVSYFTTVQQHSNVPGPLPTIPPQGPVTFTALPTMVDTMPAPPRRVEVRLARPRHRLILSPEDVAGLETLARAASRGLLQIHPDADVMTSIDVPALPEPSPIAIDPLEPVDD